MGKRDLVGGSLWEQYSKKVVERMSDPTHMGEITPEEARAAGAELVVAEWGAEACGDAVQLYWAVEASTGKILSSRFKSFGCGTAIASSDVMAELCIGKTVDEAIRITNLDVERALRDNPDTPAIPPQKMHCSVMAYDVIKKAASIYKGVDLDSLEEKEMVCECARVTLGTIKDVIRLNDLTTVEEITRFTKAGAFCKSCIRPGGHEKRKYYLVDILRDTREEMDREKVRSASTAIDFRSMTTIRKYRAVEEVLDRDVRSMLASDGGSVEVVDIRDADGETEVFIRYSGACSSCPSAGMGTLDAIGEALTTSLDPKIRVKKV